MNKALSSPAARSNYTGQINTTRSASFEGIDNAERYIQPPPLPSPARRTPATTTVHQTTCGPSNVQYEDGVNSIGRRQQEQNHGQPKIFDVNLSEYDIHDARVHRQAWTGSSVSSGGNISLPHSQTQTREGNSQFPSLSNVPMDAASSSYHPLSRPSAADSACLTIQQTSYHFPLHHIPHPINRTIPDPSTSYTAPPLQQNPVSRDQTQTLRSQLSAAHKKIYKLEREREEITVLVQSKLSELRSLVSKQGEEKRLALGHLSGARAELESVRGELKVVEDARERWKESYARLYSLHENYKCDTIEATRVSEDALRGLGKRVDALLDDADAFSKENLRLNALFEDLQARQGEVKGRIEEVSQSMVCVGEEEREREERYRRMEDENRVLAERNRALLTLLESHLAKSEAIHDTIVEDTERIRVLGSHVRDMENRTVSLLEQDTQLRLGLTEVIQRNKALQERSDDVVSAYLSHVDAEVEDIARVEAEKEQATAENRHLRSRLDELAHLIDVGCSSLDSLPPFINIDALRALDSKVQALSDLTADLSQTHELSNPVLKRVVEREAGIREGVGRLWKVYEEEAEAWSVREQGLLTRISEMEGMVDDKLAMLEDRLRKTLRVPLETLSGLDGTVLGLSERASELLHQEKALKETLLGIAKRNDAIRDQIDVVSAEYLRDKEIRDGKEREDAQRIAILEDEKAKYERMNSSLKGKLERLKEVLRKAERFQGTECAEREGMASGVKVLGSAVADTFGDRLHRELESNLMVSSMKARRGESPPVSAPPWYSTIKNRDARLSQSGSGTPCTNDATLALFATNGETAGKVAIHEPKPGRKRKISDTTTKECASRSIRSLPHVSVSQKRSREHTDRHVAPYLPSSHPGPSTEPSPKTIPTRANTHLKVRCRKDVRGTLREAAMGLREALVKSNSVSSTPAARSS